MKFAFSLVALMMIMVVSPQVNAQNKHKFGHIDSQKLLEAMPERQAAQDALMAETKKLETQLEMMTNEYRLKVEEYQSMDSLSPLIREYKEQEIVSLQTRIQNFQLQAEEALARKEGELLQPIIDKAKAAIKAVSDANGYTYVFDTSAGTVLHYPDGDDILPLVMKHMGLTNPPATPTE